MPEGVRVGRGLGVGRGVGREWEEGEWVALGDESGRLGEKQEEDGWKVEGWRMGWLDESEMAVLAISRGTDSTDSCVVSAQFSISLGWHNADRQYDAY